MAMKSLPSLSKLTILAIMVVMTIVCSNLNWGKQNWVDILESDARGYYAWLPAVFIYKDLNFNFFEKIEKEKYYNKNLYYDYRIGAYNHSINKYFCGTALAELPFFLTAHALARLLDLDADGYSKIYPVSISIAALFYLFAGLFFLRKALGLYQIGEGQKAMVMLACVFGTNLFYYTIGEPGMSHIFSFAFMSLFLFYSKAFFLYGEKKYIILVTLVVGMIVLIRPINGIIVLLLPFIAGSWKQINLGTGILFKNPLTLAFGLACFTAMVSIQLILYKISTGHFFVYSYNQEVFHFNEPHFFDILFSYKKGLFLYTPVYLLSLAGLFFLFKDSKFEFYSWTGFFILLNYVLSSWWMWFYGGSFSSRVYVEYLPFFMVLLAIALQKIRSLFVYRVFISLVFIFILLCQVQTYQYRYTQIHWSDMTKEKYWDVFLRLDRTGR